MHNIVALFSNIKNNLWHKYNFFLIDEHIYICLSVFIARVCVLYEALYTKAPMQTCWFSCAKIIDIISAVALNNIAQQRKYRFAVGKFAENQGHNPQKWFECQMGISKYMTKHIHEYKRMTNVQEEQQRNNIFYIFENIFLISFYYNKPFSAH